MKLSKSRVLEEKGQMGLGFSVAEMTRLPASDWEPPDLSSLPDRLEGPIGIDLETEDNGLNSGQGPGWAWTGGGRVIGYSVTADNFSGYLPIGHAEGNVDPDRARRWLNHVLSDPSQPKLFANALYDLGWSMVDGVSIAYDPGKLVDVQLVEPLLDEHRLSYDLDALGRERAGRGKDERMLVEAGVAYGLGDKTREIKKRLAQLPARFVAPYAIEDSRLPRDIWEVQRQLVEQEELGNICSIEHDLVPMYLDMRRRGVRIDVPHVEQMRDRLVGEIAELRAEVRRLTGIDVEVWEPRSVARLLDRLGVPYDLTPKSREPRINNKVLEDGPPALRLVLAARQKDKLRGTFLEGQILEQLKGDRVYGQVHPLKSDDGGTVTGRISMSNPNLLFIPARTAEGRMIRQAFLAEEGEVWNKNDVSQQEVRLLVHFAVATHNYEKSVGKRGMPSALDAQKRYREDAHLNYHRFVAEITGLEYQPAKILNLAIIYGRGTKEVANELGITIEEAKALFKKHSEKMPYARQMSYKCQDRVASRGYLRTLLGRRQHFPLFEPKDWDIRDGRMLPKEMAERAWPGVELVRARLHKSLNALIQPSAADQTKKSMLDVWQAGYGHHVMIQVYDELDSSVPDPKIGKEIAEVMEQSVQLEVPVIVDSNCGANWGDAK